MRFAWVGGHAEGIPALSALLEAGAPIQAVLTLRPDLAAKRSSIADYGPVCEQFRVPLHFIANINEVDTCRILSGIEPDVVFVIGWHQIVRPATLRRARIGMIGAHASMLPHNRGSAPINWALIRGERETGSTLYWLSDHIDAMRIIDQTAFPITLYDTCATLYQQVALSNREMLLRLLPRLMAGERPGRPMPFAGEPALRRRRPADGGIDWRLRLHTCPDAAFLGRVRKAGRTDVVDLARWRFPRHASECSARYRTCPRREPGGRRLRAAGCVRQGVRSAAGGAGRIRPCSPRPRTE